MDREDGDRALRLRKLLQQLFRRFGALSAEATPCGKPLSMAHAHALMVMLERGELSQQELGAELRIDKSNVARLSARMVDAGHAEQSPSDTDGRSRRVSLSARGRRLAKEVEVASKARFEALLAGLPARRQASVLEALDLLVDAMGSLPSIEGTQP